VAERIPVLVIDYGMGNLRSVGNAFRALGCEAVVSRNPNDLTRAERVVLPGVGAFGDGIRNLMVMGWIEALEKEVREKGKPFLGLCLGMHLLATTGTEHGIHRGLDWIPGIVKRIQVDDPSIRVPHIGWNDVHFKKTSCLYRGLENPQTFYFVHSFVFFPEEVSITSGICSYGIDLVASIEKDNIFATQFHPEKSQKAGIAILKNFVTTPS
jgi:imidazole glycerol-phosphate synthase subunit HisH